MGPVDGGHCRRWKCIVLLLMVCSRASDVSGASSSELKPWGTRGCRVVNESCSTKSQGGPSGRRRKSTVCDESEMQGTLSSSDDLSSRFALWCPPRLFQWPMASDRVQSRAVVGSRSSNHLLYTSLYISFAELPHHTFALFALAPKSAALTPSPTSL